jgi:hypothetical protein
MGKPPHLEPSSILQGRGIRLRYQFPSFQPSPAAKVPLHLTSALFAKFAKIAKFATFSPPSPLRRRSRHP